MYSIFQKTCLKAFRRSQNVCQLKLKLFEGIINTVQKMLASFTPF